jgi:hypothetical protein
VFYWVVRFEMDSHIRHGGFSVCIDMEMTWMSLDSEIQEVKHIVFFM